MQRILYIILLFFLLTLPVNFEVKAQETNVGTVIVPDAGQGVLQGGQLMQSPGDNSTAPHRPKNMKMYRFIKKNFPDLAEELDKLPANQHQQKIEEYRKANPIFNEKIKEARSGNMNLGDEGSDEVIKEEGLSDAEINQKFDEFLNSTGDSSEKDSVATPAAVNIEEEVLDNVEINLDDAELVTTKPIIEMTLDEREKFLKTQNPLVKEHYKQMQEEMQQLQQLPGEQRDVRINEIENQLQERRVSRRSAFMVKWDEANADKKHEFCNVALRKCSGANKTESRCEFVASICEQ